MSRFSWLVFTMMENKAPIRVMRYGTWLLLFSFLRLGNFMLVAVAETQFCDKFVRSHCRYTCTEYEILSADGFLLLLHRVRAISNSCRDHNQAQQTTHDLPIQRSSPGTSISHSTDEGEPKYNPVLLMHPELLNGDSWFMPVEPSGVVLPFVLAEDGFDVWIGHERATYWSHGHAHLKSQTPAYWNWTWDQQAQCDVPAMLQFVNSKTRSKVHYISLSQSAAVGVAAATMPEVSSLLQTLTLIGPPIYRATASLLLRAWAGFFGNLLDGSAYGAGEGPFNFSRDFRKEFLPLKSGATWAFLTSISGFDCCLSETTVLVDNGWDGSTSFKNLLHIQQGIVTNTFQQFDYGTVRQNMEAYGGSERPPVYEPNKIPPHIPILIIYGGQDSYAPPSGVKEFAELLVRPPTLVFLPFYAHFDLFLSMNRLDHVFTPIKVFLQNPPSEPEVLPPNSTSSTIHPLPTQPYTTNPVPTNRTLLTFP